MNAYVRRASQKISKLTDEQVEQILKVLSDEISMLDSVFESLSAGLLIADENFKLLLINKAAERVLPFSVRPDDVRVETIPLWQIIADEPVSQFLKECYEKKISNISDEFTITSASGTVRFVIVTVLPFVRQQQLAGTLVTVRDITEQRNQEILLRRMENLAGLTNIAAGMAHEIKNPLGAISIHIQLMQKAIKKSRESDCVLPDEKFLEHYLDVINEEIDTLNKTVMDFLMAVRPVKAQFTLVEPASLLENIVEFISPEFMKSGIRVNLKLSKNKTRLLIDEKLFREVIINIAQNALMAIQEKFSENLAASESSSLSGNRSASEGGSPSESLSASGRLDFTTFLKNDKYIITIEDNGKGMSEDVAARIFEPYFTTKANGTGLGMTTVYKIIKEFSGDIQVKSTLGEGTLFTLTFPIPQTDKKLLTDNSGADDASEKNKNFSVEIIDDDSEKIAEKMAAK